MMKCTFISNPKMVLCIVHGFNSFVFKGMEFLNHVNSTDELSRHHSGKDSQLQKVYNENGNNKFFVVNNMS